MRFASHQRVVTTKLVERSSAIRGSAGVPLARKRQLGAPCQNMTSTAYHSTQAQQIDKLKGRAKQTVPLAHAYWQSSCTSEDLEAST